MQISGENASSARSCTRRGRRRPISSPGRDSSWITRAVYQRFSSPFLLSSPTSPRPHFPILCSSSKWQGKIGEFSICVRSKDLVGRNSAPNSTCICSFGSGQLIVPQESTFPPYFSTLTALPPSCMATKLLSVSVRAAAVRPERRARQRRRRRWRQRQPN